jgi:hypothetical protein
MNAGRITHIPSNISHYLKGKGFDTLIENIPSKGDNFLKILNLNQYAPQFLTKA